MDLENKHLEHIAEMQAMADFSWSSWNSPIGLSIFFLGGSLSVAAILLSVGEFLSLLHTAHIIH